MSALAAIYSILKANSPVNTAASGGIYTLRAKQSAVPPYVITRVEDIQPHDTKDGVSTTDHYFIVIETYAKTYALAEDLSDKVRTALDRFSGTIASVNVNSIVFETKVDFYDEAAEFHRHEQDFMVRINN